MADVFSEARSLGNRLDAITKAVEEELKTSPQQIRERGAQKRLAAISKASPEARAMLVSTGKLTEDEVKRALVPEKPAESAGQQAEEQGGKAKAR
jgi:hypothetical protein